MAIHNLRGTEAEQMAADYFLCRGYNILHRNWRCSHYETDLIAENKGVLHFIEVKYRHSNKFGHPEEAVTRKKFGHLQNSALFFLLKYPKWKHIQFDILAITRQSLDHCEFFLIEDVYF